MWLILSVISIVIISKVVKSNVIVSIVAVLPQHRLGNTKGGHHCTIDLLFDQFGLVCFAIKNKNGQLSSWFQTSRTGGLRYSVTSPFSIPWLSRTATKSWIPSCSGGGGDSGEHRQDRTQRGGRQEEAQRNPVGTPDRRK